MHFTGSNLGAAAFMVSGSTQAGEVELASGGTLHLDSLSKNVIYECGLFSATSAAATEHILVLKR